VSVQTAVAVGSGLNEVVLPVASDSPFPPGL
jgi:hypothetical protein